ncbi:caspase-8-like [Clupea harengus]|uniref:Caspase-8 n=1 Tax=Clupea harengus TaxID=7950 RepID=A0A8M1KUE8_CLUHA|nr:caspase-8-like [Clupea harengus]
MKFLDEAQGTAVTRRTIEGTNDDGDLANLLLQAFEGDVVSKTKEIMRFIGCNFTASKLREDYPKSIEIQQLSDPTQVYSMNSKPRGTCVIFNNVNFFAKSKREGCSKKKFQWLGFHPVDILKDKTVQEMENHLEDLSKRVTGDCFVCCVLSHGNETGVNGSDDKILSIGDILSPFSGDRCQALAGKPKVFFIQACRGLAMQDKVQADDSDNSLDRIISIPIYADFLLSMSTFEGFVSCRDPEQGTWFIQSLCRQLAESCPKSEDILSILTKVNNDVGEREAFLSKDQAKRFCKESAKQSPESRFTLRKKLVFHVPE